MATKAFGAYAALLMASAACIGSGEEVERGNSGVVQVDAANAQDGIQVTVSLDECLSSSCDVDRVFSCAMERIDNRIVITSSFQWTTGADNACTDDCGIPSTSCTFAGALEDGDYTLEHGDDTISFSVVDGEPVLPTSCFGDEGPSHC